MIAILFWLILFVAFWGAAFAGLSIFVGPAIAGILVAVCVIATITSVVEGR